MEQTHQSLSTQAVGQLIGQAFESLSPELQRAARWLLQHQAALALHSMRTSAREAGVSPATMTRLAQRLGFDGFEALREPFVRHLAGNVPMAVARRLQAKTAAAPVDDDTGIQLSARQMDVVASATALNAGPALYAAADAMLRARRVGFLGMRVCHGVARHLHYLYGLVATNGVLIDDTGGAMADQITRLQSDDVLLAISQAPYTRQTVESVQLAHEQQVGVIALTDSALSPIARRAQHVLLFKTTSTAYFHSTLGAEALAELLLATLASRGGAATQQRLQHMHEHLRRSRAYWERPAAMPGSRLASKLAAANERAA